MTTAQRNLPSKRDTVERTPPLVLALMERGGGGEAGKRGCDEVEGLKSKKSMDEDGLEDEKLRRRKGQDEGFRLELFLGNI